METTKKRLGYKASDNGVCRGMLYEVGKTYKHEGAVQMCVKGFHYCENIDDVLEYYTYVNGVTKIFEIEDIGDGYKMDNKTVTDAIRIIREIPLEEFHLLMKHNFFDDNGNLIRYTTTYGYWEKYEINKLNQRVNSINSNTYEIKYQYNDIGQLIRREDSAGYWMCFVYDENGKITSTTSGEKSSTFIA